MKNRRPAGAKRGPQARLTLRTSPLIDDHDRRRIRTELDSTLIVEASAGTGKMTELVQRIVNVLARGRSQVHEIVAVTFTEKAAGELKLRLREALDRARLDIVSRESIAVAEPRGTKHRKRLDTSKIADHRIEMDAASEARNLERALERLEESRINTIHGFCADLLRERPVEARVDPLFVVLTEGQAQRTYDEAFAGWMQG